MYPLQMSLGNEQWRKRKNTLKTQNALTGTTDILHGNGPSWTDSRTRGDDKKLVRKKLAVALI